MAQDFLDRAGATYLAGKIKELFRGKVDKVDGKGLSTNDLTNELKKKIEDSALASEVPKKLSDLEADNTHRTVTDTEKAAWNAKQATIAFNTTYNADTNKAATMRDITEAISGITGIDFKVVDVLPTVGKSGVIYLISHDGTGTDVYDEYIWLKDSSKYEKIGSTSVDLSEYLKKTDMVPISNDEIDAMFV